jgi:hypothetical protein
LKEVDMAEVITATAGRSMADGKSLAEQLAAVGPKPVPMEERPDMPVALIVKDWLDGANEHYRRLGEELTIAWARKMLELEDQRHQYMRRALEALSK